jgi:hypothetical protein
MKFLLLFLIPLMSWLDRQRGTPKETEIISKVPALLGMGYLCAVFTGHILDWQAIVIMLAVAVAHNFSFGEPLGHALTGIQGATADDGSTYETWQVGILKDNPWIALTVRGMMVGAMTLLALDWVASLKIAIAFGAAFPLASAIVRYGFRQGGEGWALQEWIRGGLIGLILFGGAL